MTTDQQPDERPVDVMVDVVSYCLKQPEFVAEFNRLTGHALGQPRTNLDRMIDEATGWEDEQLRAFSAFVVEFVAVPWLGQMAADGPARRG